MQDTGRYLLKHCILFLNLLIVFAGAVAIGLGLWIALDEETFISFTKINELDRLDPSVVQLASYILVAGGGAAFLFGFLAITAVSLENNCLLSFYIAIITVAFALQITTATVGFIFKEKWERHIVKEIKQEIYSEFDGKKNSNNTFTRILNSFQIMFECCGVNNYTDYEKTTKWDKWMLNTSFVMRIPPSCCRDRKFAEDCLLFPTAKNSFIKQGCKAAVSELLTRYHGILIGMSVTIFCLEFLSVILSLAFLGIIVSKQYDLDH